MQSYNTAKAVSQHYIIAQKYRTIQGRIPNPLMKQIKAAMEFSFKKTNQLTDNEKAGICSLFNRVFSKEKTIDKFNKQFGGTASGYSYHSLMIDNGNVVGCYTSIPFRYMYFGRETLFALSVDTMIDEQYRGKPYDLKKMANLVYDALAKDGIPFVFGFPNENIYVVRKKLFKWVDIGRLDFFALPLRVGAVKKKLKPFNLLSRAYCALINKIPSSFERSSSGAVISNGIEKVNDNSFLLHRYDESYRIIKSDSGSFFVYKNAVVDGIRTAYLVDVFPKSKNLLESAVKGVYDNEKSNTDIILYVGKLEAAPLNLLRVPEKYAPKTVYMSGKILIDGVLDDRVYDISNWNVNLSNIDVV